MTGFNVFESRLSVQDGPNYMIWSATSIRVGLWIIRRILTLSYSVCEFGYSVHPSASETNRY